MTGKQKTKHTCKACGKAVNADDIRRCKVCEENFCPGCVINIADNTVCSECKGWALDSIEKGRPVEPYVKRKIDLPFVSMRQKEETITPKHVGRRSFAKLVLGLLAGAGLLAFAMYIMNVVLAFLGLVVLLGTIWRSTSWVLDEPENFLDSIEFGESEITCRFAEREVKLKWSKIKQVIFRNGIFDQPVFITLRRRGGKIHIDENYERFNDIAVLVWNICREEGIPYMEK
jgi:hypothetical protein